MNALEFKYMALFNKKAYPEICFKILDDLKEKLPDHLTYHTVNHVIDVANVCNTYIEHFNIGKDMAKLIRIASISHDYGYIISPTDHEERSIVNIEPYLKTVLTNEEIKIVNGLIRATKVPQQPKTSYEEIIADADLDYLGRKDYDILSHNLYEEFVHYNVVSNQKEWLNLQIQFLENHKYHTQFARVNREKAKAEKLKELKVILTTNNF